MRLLPSSSACVPTSRGCEFLSCSSFSLLLLSTLGQANLSRAASVNPSILPNIGDADKLYFMFYFWGYTSAFVVYSLLSYFFPAPETKIPATIYDDTDIISGEEKAESDTPDEGKKNLEIETSPV